MKKLLFGFLFAGLLASADPVSVTFVGAGDGMNNGSFYVGPYTLSIDGGANVDAMCVDPLHDSNPGTTYLANLTQLGTDLSNTYLGSNGAAQYEEAAYLFNLLEQLGADRVGIQEAVWQIMSPGDTDPRFNTSPNDAGYIADAQANYQNFDYTRYMIVSSAGDPSLRQQEFLTTSSVPEPASLALMGIAGIGLGALRLRKKKSCQ